MKIISATSRISIIVAAGLFLISCGMMPPKGLRSFKGKGPMALVGFSLDNIVRYKGTPPTEEDEGMLTGNEEIHFKAATKTLFDQFLASYNRGMGGHATIPVEKVQNSAVYKEKFELKTKKVFGLPLKSNPGGSNWNKHTMPDNLYFIDVSRANEKNLNTQDLDAVAKDLGAGLLLFIKYKASYQAVNPADDKRFGGIGHTIPATMNLTITATLYEPGVGFTWEHTRSNDSEKQQKITTNFLDEKYYSELLGDANSPKLINVIQEIFKAYEEGAQEEKKG